MLKAIKSLFSSAPLTIEQWAERSSRLVPDGPDGIIAAAIVQSFAKDFDKWTSLYFNDPESAYSYGSGGKASLTFSDRKKTLTVKRTAQRKSNPYGPDQYRFNNEVFVNGIPISPACGKIIVSAWDRISRTQAAAKAAAEEAKKNMSRNEQAWNLVEDLLGMTRNEHGALVPKETVK